jgi:membrane protein implicated in regulation of membrane protease activity
MRAAAFAIIVVGITFAIGVALSGNFDAAGIAILALIVAVGMLGVAVVRRSGTTAIEPVRCAECGGLLSPHAPYCKHCGAPHP